MVKKISFSLFMLCCCTMTSFAQDIILKTDGSEIKAKVVEITDTQVKYKDYDFQEGPLRNVKISDVFLITYENGQKEVFSQQNKTVVAKKNDAKQSEVTPNAGEYLYKKSFVDLDIPTPTGLGFGYTYCLNKNIGIDIFGFSAYILGFSATTGIRYMSTPDVHGKRLGYGRVRLGVGYGGIGAIDGHSGYSSYYYTDNIEDLPSFVCSVGAGVYLTRSLHLGVDVFYLPAAFEVDSHQSGSFVGTVKHADFGVSLTIGFSFGRAEKHSK